MMPTIQQTLTYVLYDICDHPEYIEKLRDEFAHGQIKSGTDDLPLMDSFLKESARLHPADTGASTI